MCTSDLQNYKICQGVSFFAPQFCGTQKEALRYIVDHHLAPSVLARSAFCGRAIENAVKTGCEQVVLYACGYDTFSMRNQHKGLKIYELDRPEMIRDKQRRVNQIGSRLLSQVEYIACDLSLPSWKEMLIRRGFDSEKPFFGSLLGSSYYLEKDAFKNLIGTISVLASEGTSICFDYPMEDDGEVSLRTRALAAAAGEKMKAKYGFGEIQTLLEDAGFSIVEQMDADEMTRAFFEAYNLANEDHAMAAPKGVGYCLAEKRP